MSTMPEKPHTWASLWVALSNPLWQGAIMAILISCLRVLYDANKGDKQAPDRVRSAHLRRAGTVSK